MYKRTGSHTGYLRFGFTAERRKSYGKVRQSESALHGLVDYGTVYAADDIRPLKDFSSSREPCVIHRQNEYCEGKACQSGK